MMTIYHRYRIRALLTFVLQLLVINESKMELSETDTEYSYDITIYNGIQWDAATIAAQYFSSKNVSHIPIIRLDQQYGGFNPCLEHTMTSELLEPHLQDFFTANSQFKRENGWFAFLVRATITSKCGGIIPVHLIYPAYAGRVAQNVGADGVLWFLSNTNGEGVGIAASDKVVLPPDVDIEKHKVRGTEIKIPVFTIETFQYIKGQLLDIGSTKHNWSIVLTSYLPLADYNPFDVLVARFGLYRIIWWVTGICSILLGLLIAKNCKDVIMYYKNKSEDAAQVALRMRMLILIPELLNSMVRFLVALDPFGAFYIFNFVQGRTFFTLSNSLSTFTDIAMVIHCWDIYNVYKSSGKFQKVQPFLMRHKMGGTLLLSFVFLMIIVDIVVVLLGLYGHLGVDIVLMPVLYMLVANTVVVTVLLKISSMMRKEVQNVLTSLVSSQKKAIYKPGKSEQKKNNHNTTSVSMVPSASKVTPASIELEVVRLRTETFLTMRHYMILAAVGRIATILSFVIIGSNLFYHSVFVFGFSLALLGVASQFTSFFQVLTALQLPSKKENTSKSKIQCVRKKKKEEALFHDHNNENNHKNTRTTTTDV